MHNFNFLAKVRRPILSVTSSVVNTEEDNNIEDRRPPGELDDEETEEFIARVKTMKSTNPRPTGKSTSVG